MNDSFIFTFFRKYANFYVVYFLNINQKEFFFLNTLEIPKNYNLLNNQKYIYKYCV